MFTDKCERGDKADKKDEATVFPQTNKPPQQIFHSERDTDSAEARSMCGA